MTLGPWEIASKASDHFNWLFDTRDEIHGIGVRTKNNIVFICLTLLPGTLEGFLKYLEEVECEYLIKEKDNWYVLYEDHKVEIRFKEREIAVAH